MKVAYPNYSDIIPQPSYNLSKWMDALKGIYVKSHLGTQRSQAIEQTIGEWSPTERTDFMNWMKYYESGDQLKYKTAQQHTYYVDDNIPNYFIPNPKAPIPSPLKAINEQVNAAIGPELPKVDPQEEKRRVVELQRSKILARLNAAEKLLSSHQ